MASIDVLPMSATTTTFTPLDTFSSLDAYSSLDQPTPAKRKRQTDVKSHLPPGLDKMINKQDPPKLAFDAEKHLNFEPPSKVYTMKDIGMENKGVSPNAVSEPFQLFSPEAVQQMRAETLREEVFANCQYSSNLAKGQLRGMAPNYAPFVYDAWRSPEVLAIVSKIAGIELVPQMDLEIAHMNVSLQNQQEEDAAVKALAERASREADEGVSGCPWEDDQPIVNWHTDSYPFVCVLMLSDCTNMIGGETALRTGTGEIMKVRGPGMGCAVVLQGRYIEHQALRVLGGERITMVTSFRPKNVMIRDDTVLTTVRAVSDLSELYFQYTEYRLEMLEERVRAQMKDIRERKRAGRRFDTISAKRFIAEQEKFLTVMNRELVDDDKVIKGFTASDHLLSDDLKLQYNKRIRTHEHGSIS